LGADGDQSGAIEMMRAVNSSTLRIAECKHVKTDVYLNKSITFKKNLQLTKSAINIAKSVNLKKKTQHPVLLSTNLEVCL
jgi:hypothetical protein